MLRGPGGRVKSYRLKVSMRDGGVLVVGDQAAGDGDRPLDDRLAVGGRDEDRPVALGEDDGEGSVIAGHLDFVLEPASGIGEGDGDPFLGLAVGGGDDLAVQGCSAPR